MSESKFRELWKKHNETGKSILDLESRVHDAAQILAHAIESGNKIIFCGNGGSAADAQHAAGEFVVKMERERRPLPAMALAADAPLISAAANDYSFDSVFERSVRALGRAGDVLVGISTSGRSENVRRAFVAAGDEGLLSIALLGRDGGFTRGLADVELIVPGTATARIQEWHIFLLHVMIELAEDKLALFP